MTNRTAPVAPVTPVKPMPPVPRTPDLGLLAAVVSAAAFGTSGAFAKALLQAGWTPGSVVFVRIVGAGLILAVPAIVSCRGRWQVVLRSWPLIVTFGVVAVALPQLAYFNAVQRLSVGVALLLEYSGVVLVVLFVWWRLRRAPSRLTAVGALVSLGGLAFVLDIGGQSRPDVIGVMWGLAAAVGLAAYFVTAGRGDAALPPTALAALGMAVGGVALGALGVAKVLPMRFSTSDVLVAGSSWPWWTALLELAAIAAAAAYLLGTYAVRRLGSTVASFVGLSEVLFAVLFAWVLLGELPRVVQLAGGALVVAGVFAVRLGEAREPQRRSGAR